MKKRNSDFNLASMKTLWLILYLDNNHRYSNQEVISMVRGGELLALPVACPHPMYTLMTECWRHAPLRRPNFEEIVNR